MVEPARHDVASGHLPVILTYYIPLAVSAYNVGAHVNVKSGADESLQVAVPVFGL